MSGYTYDTDFMRKAVGFVPTQSVDMKWSDEDAQGFDAWLAQVKRDAAREALDGLAQWAQQDEGIAETDPSAPTYTRLIVNRYRNAYYPEETP